MGKYKIIIHVVHFKLQFQWENMFNFNGKQIFNFNGEHIFKLHDTSSLSELRLFVFILKTQQPNFQHGKCFYCIFVK
jgi:hypothetical protein